MQSNDQLNSLLAGINSTLTFQGTDLITRNDWGVVNFKLVESEINIIFEILKVLTELPIIQLPNPVFKRLQSNVLEINNLFAQINDFDISQPNPTTTRDNLATEIKEKAENFYQQIAVWIPYLLYLKGDYQRNLNEITLSLNEAKKLIDNIKKQSEEIINESKKESEQTKKEIDAILAGARKASAQIGVTVFATDFSQEASDLSKNARKWLITTLILTCLTFALALLSWFYELSPTVTNYQLLYKLGSKIAILAILFTATVWSGRIYKALRHQSAVNRHRALSLQTFQAFTNATSDEATKNAVLMETTKTIFGSVSTGYLDQKDETTESSVKIVEIFKSMLGPKD